MYVMLPLSKSKNQNALLRRALCCAASSFLSRSKKALDLSDQKLRRFQVILFVKVGEPVSAHFYRRDNYVLKHGIHIPQHIPVVFAGHIAPLIRFIIPAGRNGLKLKIHAVYCMRSVRYANFLYHLSLMFLYGSMSPLGYRISAYPLGAHKWIFLRH